MFAINGQAFCGSGPGVFRSCCCQSAMILVGTNRARVYALSPADGSTVWLWQSGSTPAPQNVAGTAGTIAQNAASAYVPVIRNSTWSGSGGVTATVVVLSKSTGLPVLSVDTGSAMAVAVLADGSFVVGGITNVLWTGAAGRSANLWKFSSAGALLWYQNINPGSNVSDVCLASNGNIIVGMSFSGGINAAVVRASDGVVLNTTISGTSAVRCIDCRSTDEVILGSTGVGGGAPGQGRTNAWTNSLLTRLWGSALPPLFVNHDTNDLAAALTEASSTSFYYFVGSGGSLTKANISGAAVSWTGSGVYGVTSVSSAPVAEDGVVAGGTRNTAWPGAGGQSRNVWRWNANGTLKWAVDLNASGLGENVTGVCGGPSVNL